MPKSLRHRFLQRRCAQERRHAPETRRVTKKRRRDDRVRQGGARRVDRSAATSTLARSAEPSGVPRRKKDETGTMLVISGNSFLKTSTSEPAQTISHFEKFKVRSCSRAGQPKCPALVSTSRAGDRCPRPETVARIAAAVATQRSRPQRFGEVPPLRAAICGFVRS
jgi:hypothetical protein